MAISWGDAKGSDNVDKSVDLEYHRAVEVGRYNKADKQQLIVEEGINRIWVQKNELNFVDGPVSDCRLLQDGAGVHMSG